MRQPSAVIYPPSYISTGVCVTSFLAEMTAFKNDFNAAHDKRSDIHESWRVSIKEGL